MKKPILLLAIETSCDDTGIALLKVSEHTTRTTFTTLANEISSQVALHQQYGGVFPAMAKREHARNIVPLFVQALRNAKLLKPLSKKSTPSNYAIIGSREYKKLQKVLEREAEMFHAIVGFLSAYEMPQFDQLVVTSGPGLEPTLWVGINFARALSMICDVNIMPVNHMEGHVLSVAIPEQKTFTITPKTFSFPMLSLLVSGGHSELVLVRDIGTYKILGATRDDAAGEAFDKIARMMDLPYPGGPEISRLANEVRNGKNPTERFALPRPMIHSKDFDFSFSGLKTAVLYLIRDMGTLSDTDKKQIAYETENAIVDVLVHKTITAAQKHKTTKIIVGGGVAANAHLRNVLTAKAHELGISVHFPTPLLSRDNALMIALAGYFKSKRTKKFPRTITAEGNMQLG